jgi:methylenetetrahydrofolate dehydrogenase (NADP+)/methenyltetrahydrofolate cyclohydrolase
MLHHQATVTVCHTGTKRLADHTRRADILIVAVGKAGLVHGGPGEAWGARDRQSARTRGPTDSSATSTSLPVSPVAGILTPVPGGVGPVTVAMLLRNTLRAAGASI